MANFFAVALQQNRFVVLKESWVQNPTVGEFSKVYVSNNEENIPNFAMKTKYLLNKSEDGCYIARVVKQFKSEAEAENFISWKRPEFYPDKKKRFQFTESTMIASIDLATSGSDSDETLSVTNNLESVDIVSTNSSKDAEIPDGSIDSDETLWDHGDFEESDASLSSYESAEIENDGTRAFDGLIKVSESRDESIDSEETFWSPSDLDQSDDSHNTGKDIQSIAANNPNGAASDQKLYDSLNHNSSNSDTALATDRNHDTNHAIVDNVDNSSDENTKQSDADQMLVDGETGNAHTVEDTQFGTTASDHGLNEMEPKRFSIKSKINKH